MLGFGYVSSTTVAQADPTCVYPVTTWTSSPYVQWMLGYACMDTFPEFTWEGYAWTETWTDQSETTAFNDNRIAVLMWGSDYCEGQTGYNDFSGSNSHDNYFYSYPAGWTGGYYRDCDEYHPHHYEIQTGNYRYYPDLATYFLKNGDWVN